MDAKPSGGSHKKGDRHGLGQSTAYPRGARAMRKYAIANSGVFVEGNVCPVLTLPQNDFKTNGNQNKLNSKRIELSLLLGTSAK